LGVDVLDYTQDWRLALASVVIALMAAFTGLSLTQGASALTVPARKALVSLSAAALGGGIWSMHFVAMLGLNLPVIYFYDALTTLVSMLVAMLVTGLAFLILHFRPRSAANLTAAGSTIGLGIALMHYIGMSGMENCRPVYTVTGVALATAASILLSILAIRIAYGRRARGNILMGTLGLGLAVVTAHYVAMAGTGFVASGPTATAGPVIGNDTLALLVTVAAFVISAAVLLTGITFFPAPTGPVAAVDAAGSGTILARAANPIPVTVAAATHDPTPAPAAAPRRTADSVPPGAADPAGREEAEPSAHPTAPRPGGSPVRIPHEREGRTFFLDPHSISAIRAEGHYSILIRGDETLFCPWSISEAAERLGPAGFLRVHRSYLLNPARIAHFERTKDSGVCSVEGAPKLRVPVSRGHLQALRETLGV
jgi:NO-binding membrane sensor protein with MHYT domain